MITTEDIKLTNNLLTRTVEITKFRTDHLTRGAGDGVAHGHDSRGYLTVGDTDYDRSSSVAYSEDALLVNNYKTKKVSKPVEFFSGEDPWFNCPNLVVRIKSMTKQEAACMVIWVFVLIIAILAVVFWFNVVLTDL